MCLSGFRLYLNTTFPSFERGAWLVSSVDRVSMIHSLLSSKLGGCPSFPSFPYPRFAFCTEEYIAVIARCPLLAPRKRLPSSGSALPLATLAPSAIALPQFRLSRITPSQATCANSRGPIAICRCRTISKIKTREQIDKKNHSASFFFFALPHEKRQIVEWQLGKLERRSLSLQSPVLHIWLEARRGRGATVRVGGGPCICGRTRKWDRQYARILKSLFCDDLFPGFHFFLPHNN